MTRDTSFKDTVLFILGAFFASVALMCFLYPDLWFYHTRRLLITHETQVQMESTFILVSHFFHGGIQLWDRFDQMNNAYFVLSNGVYGVANIITAFVFIVLSPFFTHPAQALYHMHLLLYYSLTCLIRTVGGYVLLRKFISNKAVIFICLLYLNTILTSYMMTPGILVQTLYSFFPLLLYFILSFFEDLRLRSFLLATLVMALCFVSSPLFTLGYFYQAVHFFILSCIAAFLLQGGWRQLRGRPSLPRTEFLKNIGLAACCFFIVLPYLWWGHALLHDFYVHGSGLGGTQGRFNNIFNLSGYFKIFGKGFANSFEFLGTSLDYHHNEWGVSWLFLGGSSLFLALIGMVLSKDKRKYIFAATILFVILINNAWFPGNFSILGQDIQYARLDPSLFWARGMHLHDWWSYGFLMLSTVAHGINALTNPLCFLVRSFHMTSLLVSMLLLPLVAMGLQSCLCLWQRKEEAIYFNRRWFLTAFCALVLIWAILGGTQGLGVGEVNEDTAPALKKYILAIATIFFFLMIIPEFIAAKMRWVIWIILGFSFVLDFGALKTYAQIYSREYPDHAVPVRLNPSYTHQAVVPDYQNPEILPLREFLNTQGVRTNPVIYSPSAMYGAFYQYTPIGRFFHPWDIYEPRHISYRDLYPDIEIQQYLTVNPRNIFFADYAFDSRYIRMPDILRLNMADRVVMAERNNDNAPFLKTSGHFYMPHEDNTDRIYSLSLKASQARIHKASIGWEYVFELPHDFPFYLSTSVFTNDYSNWKLTVADRTLSPMQGVLTAPGTFDVQNIRDKKLTVLLADKMTPQALFDLQVKLPQGILDVWKNTYDDLGFSYQAPKAGWIVFNYPYDEKWELSIDGQLTAVSIVNRYFIGAPISGGEHQILLRYWPHTRLRSWVFISMALSVMCFLGVMFYSIKRES